MKKTTLNWRLKELPDAVDVAELVDKKVISPEEARELLFNEGGNPTQKVKELEEEVKFLRDLCDKLASKSNGWTTIVREYERYKPVNPVWYNSYGALMSTAGTMKTQMATAGMATITSTNDRFLSKLN